MKVNYFYYEYKPFRYNPLTHTPLFSPVNIREGPKQTSRVLRLISLPLYADTNNRGERYVYINVSRYTIKFEYEKHIVFTERVGRSQGMSNGVVIRKITDNL